MFKPNDIENYCAELLIVKKGANRMKEHPRDGCSILVIQPSSLAIVSFAKISVLLQLLLMSDRYYLQCYYTSLIYLGAAKMMAEYDENTGGVSSGCCVGVRDCLYSDARVSLINI